MKIYLAGAISGKSYKDALDFFESTKQKLSPKYIVLSPMVAKTELINQEYLNSHGYLHPTSTNHAIFERDKWCIQQADIVFVNLFNAERPSLGCMFELAWASLLGKHTVVVLDEYDIHKHAFVLEAGDTIFEKEEDAINYLNELIE